MYNIVSFTGPSGSGKTTLQKYLNIKPIVTWTSREPREGEINGIDYHFANRETILEMKVNNQLLEYTEYKGNLYASDISSFKQIIEKNTIASIVLDASGIRELKRTFKGHVFTVGVFALKAECYQRLHLRQDGNIEDRMADYDQEIKDMMELADIVIANSAENWSKNKDIVNWIRLGLISTI